MVVRTGRLNHLSEDLIRRYKENMPENVIICCLGGVFRQIKYNSVSSDEHERDRDKVHYICSLE